MNLLLSHTFFIIVLTCAVSMLAMSRRTLLSRLLFWPPAIKRWQFSRFITHGFVHANFQHLFFNMFTLFFFGMAIEKFYRQFWGGFGFILFYLAAIVVAVIPSYLKHRNDIDYRTLGASGAVSAVLFSFVMLAPWATIYIYILPVPAILYAVVYMAYNIYAAAHHVNGINHSAHITGALFGVLLTFWIDHSKILGFARQIMHPTIAN